MTPVGIQCFTVDDIQECWDEQGNQRPGATLWHKDHLYVMTPGGLADIATWELTGTVPTITARPSIKVSGSEGELWHGYLTDGVLHP